jgi:hypothetical protein
MKEMMARAKAEKDAAKKAKQDGIYKPELTKEDE